MKCRYFLFQIGQECTSRSLPYFLIISVEFRSRRWLGHLKTLSVQHRKSSILGNVTELGIPRIN